VGYPCFGSMYSLVRRFWTQVVLVYLRVKVCGLKMKMGNHSKRTLVAVVVSLVFHFGLAALAGAMLSGERPRELTRIEVDLELTAPIPHVPKPKPAPLPKKEEVVKPPPKPKPPKPKTPPLPKPKPKPRTVAKADPIPEPEDPAPTSDPEPENVPDDFDSEPVEHGDATSVEPQPVEKGPRLGGPEYNQALARYQRKVQRQIEKNKKTAPARSRRARESGAVKVRFVIFSNGEIDEPEVVAGPGYALLDQTALASVTSAAPFPPLPDELGVDSLTVTVPIRFKLRR